MVIYLQYKNDVVQEVTTAVLSSLNQTKASHPIVQPVYHHSRKSKSDSKRSRKCDGNE